MIELEAIEKILVEAWTDEAIRLLDEYITSAPERFRPGLLSSGQRAQKERDWQKAINNYLEAMAINPESPAANAYAIANEILDFYNKDMYNQ